jgi:hypothetical protein
LRSGIATLGAVRQRVVVVGVVAAVVLLALVQLMAIVTNDGGPVAERSLATVPAVVRAGAPGGDRSVDAYRGYGTWVDVYDFAPSFQDGGTPALGPDVIDAMAASGVRTVYLQAAQLDERSPGALVDPAVVGQFLVRAQRAGLKVVGWYLPRFTDLDRDLEHLRAIADFEALGHRFDGVAVDIEWTAGVPDPRQRSTALVDLSERLREATDGEPLGAIVLPPVQIEVVNPRFWPNFPWRRLEPFYDVWLPMSYWTERRADSGLRDARTYVRQNIERLRGNLDDPEARVHVIGGIGDQIDGRQAARFVEALDAMQAFGGSIYDWNTLAPERHGVMARGLAEDEGEG